MQQESKFIKGALILTASNLVVKILGAVYRVPLMRILGKEGMGLFMAVYPFYTMMLSISTAGVPLAVSKLVSEKLALDNYTGAKQVFKVALILMFASGMVVTGALICIAPYYTANVLKVPRTLYPMVAIAPTIVFFATKAVYRGFFQGQERMGPSAIASIVEQLVRVGTIFTLAIILVKKSLEMGAAGAAFGSVTGAAAGFIVLFTYFHRSKREYNQLAEQATANSLSPTKKVIKEIFILALPITIGSIIVPIVNMVDSTLILPRLQAGGFSEEAALGMLGIFSGAAMALVNVPSIFTLGLGASLLPAISKANAVKDLNAVDKLNRLSLKIGQIIALPSAVGLFILAEPISIFLFANAAVARPLSVVAFATIFIVLNQTTTPILQGLGKTYVPVTHMLIGLLPKLAINYFLTPIASINILGPAFGTIITFAIASFLNLRAIHRFTNTRMPFFSSFIKPAINAVLMGVSVYYIYPLFYSLGLSILGSGRSASLYTGFGTLASILVGIIIYGLSTLLTGTITRSELERVPKIGVKLAETLSRLRLLRQS